VTAGWRRNMPLAKINGVGIRYEQSGTDGPPVVLVHGSWGSHHNWDQVAPRLAERFRVVTYDRRGHSESERPSGQGSIHEDVADLAALIEHLDLAPAFVAGNSWGAIITLRLAIARPDLVRAIACHEPPLIALIADDPEVRPIAEEVRKRLAAVFERLGAGDDEGGARLFVETVAMGPGMWDKLPPLLRRTFVENGPTYLDESRDPDQQSIDLDRLRTISVPALISHGDQSPRMFPAIARIVAASIPGSEELLFPGAGHIPHATHPAEYVEALGAFINASSTEPVAKGTPQRGDVGGGTRI
jgi:pimeloyl-ACP methyl ester carboxylesterase